MNKEVLVKIANFCAYQERSHREVKERLAELETFGDDADEMTAWLIENNYLNEERFAKIFAGSKFRQKKWGRLKIKQELKKRGVSDYSLRMGMNEIDPDDYYETLCELIEKKAKDIKDSNPLIQKQKLVNFVLTKGFEQDLVWDAVNEFQKNP